MKSWPILLAVMLMVLATRVSDNEASLIETQAEDQDDGTIKHLFKRKYTTMKDRMKKKAKTELMAGAAKSILGLDELDSDDDDDD